MIGRERAGGHHDDRIAVRVIPLVSGRFPHLVVSAGVAFTGGVATWDLRYGLLASREMIRAGTPRTVQLLGTSAITSEFALTTTLSPTVTPPITLQPAPK